MAKKGTGKKKKGSRRNRDEGLDELLAVLKADPQLLSVLVLNPKALLRKVKSKAAKELIKGIEPETYLENVLFANRIVMMCPSTSVHN
jgi:hypothetical protein